MLMPVIDHTLSEPLSLTLDTMSRRSLLEALRNDGVQFNASATTLLGDPVFDHPETQSITVVERAVSELGLAGGAVLPDIFEAAGDHGLQLCPPTTGPYLRLALRTQPNAPDAIMSSGRAPTGSLTVAAVPLRTDEAYPKGFYLRVINGRPWLRGYHCGDDHAWSPDDRFVFAATRSLSATS